MRAEIVAEPRADFDRWLEEKRLAVGADLVQKVHVVADGDSLDAEELVDDNGMPVIKIAAGTRVILEVENTAGEPLDVSLSTAMALGTVPPHSTSLLVFDTAEGVPGDRVILGSNGGNLTFRAVEAEVIDIDLLSYAIEPETLQLKAGTTYLFRIHGLDSVHNFFIGHWDGEGEKEILAQSPNVGGGGTTALVYAPTETGAFDTWCDISGHYESGMHAHATVS
jgi:plastocyanin